MSLYELVQKKAVVFVDVVLSGKLLSDTAQHLNRPFAVHCCSSKLCAPFNPMLSFWNMLCKCSQSPAEGAPATYVTLEPIACTYLSLGPPGCYSRAPLLGPLLCCHRHWAGQFSFYHCSCCPAPWSHHLPCPRGEESAGLNLAKDLV